MTMSHDLYIVGCIIKLMSAWKRPFTYCLVLGTLFCMQLPSFISTGGAQAPEAAVKSALSVSPAIIESSLELGKSAPFTLTVRNVTNSPLPVTSYVRAFTVQSAELEKTDQDRLDASKWFNIQDPDFILQPNQERTVKGKITPPPGVEPGGHYATVFFQPLAREDATSSIAKITARVGVLSFLTVKGTVQESAKLTSNLETPKFIRPGPMDIKFKITNTGNVHIMPTGNIRISDWRGAVVATVDVPAGIILPNSTKEYSVPWTIPISLGRYSAELEVEYGKKNIKLDTEPASFWVMPVAEMVVGSITALTITLFIVKTHHRWSRAWRALKTNS